jgi:hypothetical protein
MKEMREQVKLDMVKEFYKRQFGMDGYLKMQRVIKIMEELYGNMLSLIGNKMVEVNELVAGSSMGGGGIISELQWRDKEEPLGLEMDIDSRCPKGVLIALASKSNCTNTSRVYASSYDVECTHNLLVHWEYREKIMQFRFTKMMDLLGENKKNKKI